MEESATGRRYGETCLKPRALGSVKEPVLPLARDAAKSSVGLLGIPTAFIFKPVGAWGLSIRHYIDAGVIKFQRCPLPPPHTSIGMALLWYVVSFRGDVPLRGLGLDTWTSSGASLLRWQEESPSGWWLTWELRMQVYVGDLILTAACLTSKDGGSSPPCFCSGRHWASTCVGKKGQVGAKVAWIGGEFSVFRGGNRSQKRKPRLQRTAPMNVCTANCGACQKLSSFIGHLSWIATAAPLARLWVSMLEK